MSQRYVIDKERGTKWFTFYTKIRPWIYCFALLESISEMMRYAEIYFQYPLLVISLVVEITSVVLCIMIFAKSKGDYKDFAMFADRVLMFEACAMAFQGFVGQYYTEGSAVAFITAVLSGLLGYYVWYRKISEYFYERVKEVQGNCESNIEVVAPTDDVAIKERKVVTADKWICSSCGVGNSPNFGQCKKCGRFRGETVHSVVDTTDIQTESEGVS